MSEKALTAGQVAFLASLRADGSPTPRGELPFADYEQDRARQKCCREGLAKYGGKPARWHITSIGLMALTR